MNLNFIQNGETEIKKENTKIAINMSASAPSVFVVSFSCFQIKFIFRLNLKIKSASIRIYN